VCQTGRGSTTRTFFAGEPSSEEKDAAFGLPVAEVEPEQFCGVLLLCIEGSVLGGDVGRVADHVGCDVRDLEGLYAQHEQRFSGVDKLQEQLLAQLYT